ncbi:MAG TPA: sigma 54-interacting transcriptional regulator, partial [Orrella sp.]
CAAIPEALIESELFGYLPGSFSGATSKGKRGLIQEADGGTLFLDEIGDMPLALQGRLLRVLAEREVQPLGATKPAKINLRVLTATNCDLIAAVKAGRFRDDLYYRLNGAHFCLPPLRERHDLPYLIKALCDASTPSLDLHPSVLEVLLSHPWPGNLRELCNVLEYARSLAVNGSIVPEDLPDYIAGAEARPRAYRVADLGMGVIHTMVAPDTRAPGKHQAVDKHQLESVLKKTGWNVSAAARELHVSRMTLYRWMKRHSVQSPNQMSGSM